MNPSSAAHAVNYLIINADDLGMYAGCNRAVLQAARAGLLTSVSLAANGEFFAEAVNEIIPACPQLGVGAHLVLNAGKCRSRPEVVPHLATRDGEFLHRGAKGFVKFAVAARNPSSRREIYDELRAQVETILPTARLDHLDGHQHIHCIPWIFEIVLRIAEEYQIPFVRLPREHANFSAFFKHFPQLINIGHWLNLQNYCRINARKITKKSRSVRVNDYFYGLMHSNAMTEEIAIYLLKKFPAAKSNKIIEMLFHPAVITEMDTRFATNVERAWLSNPQRQQEFNALLSPKLRSVVAQGNFLLTNYRALAEINADRS